MISGDDSAFVVCGDVPPRIERFLDAWLARWPELRVALEDNERDESFQRWVPGAVSLPEHTGRILVARDESMEASWDEHGYELDSSHEGPFAIAYEKAAWSVLRLTALDDPYARTGFAYEPYQATLVGQDYFLVSTVTPAVESDFSAALIKRLAESLVG